MTTPFASAFEDQWPAEFDRMASSLAAVGVTATALRPWRVAQHDLPVLALLGWGYHTSPGNWFELLDAWEAAGIRVLNSVALLRWNTDKRYLLDLAAGGTPIIQTVLMENPTSDDLRHCRSQFGCADIVVKPRIGACAFGTRRLSVCDAGLEGSLAVQPFVPEILQEGEHSLLFFDGVFSHAVIKRPAGGDFRVQAAHGGSVQPSEPPAEAIHLAYDVLAQLPVTPVYARVDLVRSAAGFRLMELELIEPQLFLGESAAGALRFAQAVKRHL